ncbi:Rho GTPase activation protein [Paraphysoderma sedebokerense]|nr:Rho GTPase activation protein [Paraphysoderma sedebokerense]
MNSCKETITFLKKRAAIEEEYAKSMTKLAQSVNEYIEKGDGKQGTFIESLRQTSKVHELIANNRLKFSQFVSEVADDLNTAFKDTERSRKQLKEAGEKHEKHLSQSEAALEKARMKYESSSDNWDKAIQMKENGGHINHGGKGMPRSMSSTIGIFQQSKKPEKLIKEEESARYKAAQANEGYKNQLAQTNQVRAEFHNVHLPRILKSLKETNDECDAALQYHLSKYSYLYEQALMSDATTISPLNSTERGLRSIIEQIDNKADLKEFVTGYVAKNTDITLAEIKEDQYGMPVVPSNKVINPTFGTNLAELLDRENSDVPSFLRNCFGLVEEFCSDAIGVYRASPPGSVLQKVKTAIDKDPSYNLRSEDVLADPSCVTGLIKIFFRELPDPLFTKIMYREFMSAARMDDERMRLLTIHDLVNKLPDPNYATLRLLMNHLDRVGQRQHRNKITVHGLSIIFGPILLSAPDGIDTTNDLYYQCKVVEIILTNFRIIFDTDE